MFKLETSEFEIENAKLYGAFTIYDGEAEFVWALGIDMKEGKYIDSETEEEPDDLDEEELDESEEEEDEDDDDDDDDFFDYVTPSLYHNNGFSLDVRSWKEIEGITLDWDSEYNDDDEEAGYLYVFYHEPLTEGKIEFLERRGDKFLVRWAGAVEDLPFVFEGEVTFTGITADCSGISTLEELKSAMKNYIDVDEYDCASYESYDNTEAPDGKRHKWQLVPNNID